MPVVAAPLFGFALGVAFAWAGSEEIARLGGAVTSRALVVAVLYGALVYAPACGYFEAFFPDWSYAYFLDAATRPVAVDLGLLLVNGASVPLGLVVFSRPAAARRSAALARGAAIPAAAAALLVVAMLPRLRIFATFAQFHGDFGTEALTGSPVGYALIWMTAVVAGAGAWTIRVLRRLTEPDTAN
jgi:hypothetical protein